MTCLLATHRHLNHVDMLPVNVPEHSSAKEIQASVQWIWIKRQIGVVWMLARKAKRKQNWSGIPCCFLSWLTHWSLNKSADIFQCISVNDYYCIFIEISPFVHIDHKSALISVMTLLKIGEKQLINYCAGTEIFQDSSHTWIWKPVDFAWGIKYCGYEGS